MIRKIITGIIIPPNAAKIGTIRLFLSDNSPIKTSLLISVPTKKKKMTIAASLIQ